MSKNKFITEVLKSGGTIGALSPSSSFLAEKMLKPIHFNEAKCIVEFGPGTGVFTTKLLEKMSPDAKLLAFEINPAFHEELKTIQDDRLIVINDSAEKIDHYLMLHRLETADYIVSSLPFAMIPDEVVDAILKNAFEALSLKGKFIQFQYSLNALSKLKAMYTKVKINFTFLNLPPAFIFICSK
ncbi:class I SAM-dependent methyltransferase [Flavobacterium humi]|uniref:Ribosomal RNA adenine dimethylase n=1 Tax=Flavobacterium humi TaxID=2562683 RepID=A0A4Z0L7W3_9FLAO|nr:rRNA adenine N-6-methyltransferase family protein [Flavobacterium humi]TGD57680.1 ribosomal RNA adenine dimethylase [Flavobacterium humi]